MYYLSILWFVLTLLWLGLYFMSRSRYQSIPTNENKFHMDHNFRFLICVAVFLLATLINSLWLMLPATAYMLVLTYVKLTRKPLDD